MEDAWVLEQTEDEILDAYTKWLHKMANSYLEPWDERHDDLVQEGRIAMWKALQTWDAEKTSLPSWLTGAAKLRMKDFAFGHGKETGHESMAGRKPAETVASVDELLDINEGDAPAFLGVSDSLESVSLAYHYGEIQKALGLLSPMQRKYVYARYWMGLDPTSRAPGMKELVALVPEVTKRHLWTGSSHQVGAKERLREALAHLEYAV